MAFPSLVSTGNDTDESGADLERGRRSVSADRLSFSRQRGRHGFLSDLNMSRSIKCILAKLNLFHCPSRKR